MKPNNDTPASLVRSLRIVGYCVLAVIMLALFVAMCAILRDSVLDHEAAQRATTDRFEQHSDGSMPNATLESTAAKPPG